MTINGNMKFFELSKALYKNGDSVSVSSGSSSQNNLIDFDKSTRWESVGTDDTTTETITITFNDSVKISRLFLINHNFKSYTVTPVTTEFILDELYDPLTDESSDEIEDSGGGVPFLNVTSITSSTAVEGIEETDYSYATSYYEFDPVYCSGIVISVTEAQEFNDVADQEKYCYMVIPTIEVNDNNGTFEMFPALQRPTDFTAQTNLTINRFNRARKLNPVFSAAISIDPTNSQQDVELCEHLQNRTDGFIFWANGGKLTINESSTPYYRFYSKPYRLQDVYQCKIDSGFLGTYLNNIHSNVLTMSIGLREVV